MTSLRSIALISVLLAACKSDASDQGAPAEAKPAAVPAQAQGKPPGSMPSDVRPPGDPHALPAPGEEPAAAPMPAASGSFDVTIDGKLQHFSRLPPAQNRAVALPEDGVTRVMIGAMESERGGPSFSLLLEGVRPDQIEYPLVLPAPADGKRKSKSKPDDGKGPTVSLRYEIHDKRTYVIDPDEGAEVQVTLEAFEGKTLRGRFEGKLAPTAAGLGDPITVSGTFAVELGLRGVEPGPLADEPAAEPPDEPAP